jgi:tetratricopeptide (TPR) repeat protein
MGNMPPDLGLPGNWNNNNIPSGKYLQDIARRQLHEINTFLTLHKNDYQFVAANLDKITEILKAALEVKGPHQEKVIRRALELEHYYWVTPGKINAWVDLLGPMLSHALNISDPELTSLLFRSWGTYIYLIQSGSKPDASQQAFTAAMEYAAESDREDIRLLAQVERLNLNAHDLAELEGVKAQAEIILEKARNLHFPYVQGRVYYSIAIAYIRAGNLASAFEYAQYAAAIFMRIHNDPLAGQSLLNMIAALPQEQYVPYKNQLFEHLYRVLKRSNNVLLETLAYQSLSCQLLKQNKYDEARKVVLESWCLDRASHYRGNYGSTRHMLGMIQAERHRWVIARHHINTAYTHYKNTNERLQAANAHHAMAYIPLVKKDYPRAQMELNEALEEAYTLPPSRGRERLIGLIKADIIKAERGIQGLPLE